MGSKSVIRGGWVVNLSLEKMMMMQFGIKREKEVLFLFVYFPGVPIAIFLAGFLVNTFFYFMLFCVQCGCARVCVFVICVHTQ